MNDTDFNYGANEQYDPETPLLDCTGRVQCTKCGKFFGYHDSITQLQEKQMLPNPDSTSGSSSGGGRTQKPSNRLHVNDLSKQPRDAKIVMVKADPSGRYGPQVICKIAVNGEIKFWYLDIKKNPNYKLLVDKFGNEENDWAGEKILLGTEQDSFSDNYFIRVSFPGNETTGGKRR